MNFNANCLRVASLVAACTFTVLGSSSVVAQTAESLPEGLTSLPERVNVQMDSARLDQIYEGRWVAVGTRKAGAVCLDATRPYQGRPSVRFTLGRDDNTLSGYAAGETKGRAEFSYCYATAADFAGVDEAEYQAANRMKTVYHHGKGICAQGSKWRYVFSIYVPSDLADNVSTIFAQWHGMPDRTLTQDPQGKARKLSVAEFLAMEDTVIIKKDEVFRRVAKTDKKGRVRYQAGEPTGWRVEQGGYPPLAFGFSGGCFYIKTNSDRRWFTDKTDRCTANPAKSPVMEPVESKYKSSTVTYREPFDAFPKDCWVTFTVEIDWTKYGGESEKIVAPGRLDVVRQVEGGRAEHLVDNARVLLGRNDEEGYYFKYGIYRVSNSTEPVSYNLAGYSQEEIR